MTTCTDIFKNNHWFISTQTSVIDSKTVLFQHWTLLCCCWVLLCQLLVDWVIADGSGSLYLWDRGGRQELDSSGLEFTSLIKTNKLTEFEFYIALRDTITSTRWMAWNSSTNSSLDKIGFVRLTMWIARHLLNWFVRASLLRMNPANSPILLLTFRQCARMNCS